MDLHGGAPTSLISTDYSETKRATGDPQVSKRPDFQGFFRFPKRLNCLISVFLYFSIFWISVSISETKRATGDPQVSKRPDFLGLFRFPKKRINFRIFVFLYFCIFFGFLAISQERKELPEICGCQNDRIFEGFSDFQKYRIFGFLNFCISAFFIF